MQAVPMIAIPVTTDQPGISARIVWSGVGDRVLLNRLNADKLRTAIQTILGNPAYKRRAQELQ